MGGVGRLGDGGFEGGVVLLLLVLLRDSSGGGGGSGVESVLSWPLGAGEGEAEDEGVVG